MQSLKIEQDARTLAGLATSEDYTRERIPLLDGGLRSDIAPTDLQPNQTPAVENLMLLAGRLRPDTGYQRFGKVLDDAPFYGTPQRPFQVFNANGTSSLLLITTDTVYVLDTAFNQWQIVPWGDFYTNTAQVDAGEVIVPVVDATGLVIGAILGLPLDDGTQLVAKITIVAGLNITIDTPVPVGRHVVISADIALGATLNGTLDNQPCILTFSALDWTIITNNVDPVFYFDGEKLSALGGLPSSTTCVYMIVFHDCLFLLNTTEIGVNRPQRIRMSDLGDPENWTPNVGTSIAAIYDLLDTEDFIQAAGTIGPYLIVYRDTAIMRGSYYGTPGQTIFWEYMVVGEGTSTPGGFTYLGYDHALIGNAGIYTYQATYNPDSIGDAVYQDFLSAVGDLNASAKSRLFCAYIGDYDELWVSYPAGDNTLPNKTLRCNLEKTAWFVRHFANKFLSCEPYLPLATTTWDTAPGTWEDNPYTWNSRIFLANVPTMLLCAADTGYVYAYDYTTPTDAGTPISWSVETKDISTGNFMNRFDSCRCFGRGTALCEVSIDGGETWTTYGTFLFGTRPSMKILTGQFTAPYIRFRLSGDDPTFQLQWLEVWYTEESEW